jgi:hypothetical protein
MVLVVVGLAEPPSMADDGVVTAKRTLPREKIQGDHPGSALSSVSGNAIKRITAGVKAVQLVLSARIAPADGPSPSQWIHCRTKKRMLTSID